MKYIIMLLMCAQCFGQIAKIDTREPIATNYVEENGDFVARADIHEVYADIKFYDKKNDADVTVVMTMDEFKQLRALLLSYDVKDKEFFMMPVKRAVISIRFVEKYGYVQSYIYVSTNGSYYQWPLMNRQQYQRLFRLQ